MRILVHDSRYEPNDSGRFPRWIFRSGLGLPSTADRMVAGREGFVHRARTGGRARRLDHLPALGPGAAALRAGPRFLRLQRRRTAGRERGRRPGARGPPLRRPTRSRRSRPPSGPGRTSSWCGSRSACGGEIELVHNGKRVRSDQLLESVPGEGAAAPRRDPGGVGFDRRVLVAVDGRLLFDPFDYDSGRRSRPGRRVPDRPGGRRGRPDRQRAADLSRPALHGHAGQHAPPGARAAIARTARPR